MREQHAGAWSPTRRVRWSRHVAPLAVALTALLAAPALAEPGKSRGNSQASPGNPAKPAPKAPPPRRNAQPKPAKPAKPKAKKPAPPRSNRPTQAPGRSGTAPQGPRARGKGPVARQAPRSSQGSGNPSQGRRAEQGKVTICHATGSSTNPYVEITVSRNAVPAHTRHQDGRDLVPAPAGGCPGSQGAGPVATNGKPGKVTLCHATGSEKNPYVLITVSESALQAHLRHQDGEDIVNPTGPCPGTPGEVIANWLPTLATVVGLPPSAGGVLPQTVAGVLGDTADSGEPAGDPAEKADGDVAGVTASSGDPKDDSLPFTGLNVALLALAGIAALLTGVGVRSAVRPR